MRFLFVTTLDVPWGGSEQLWGETAFRLLSNQTV
jgi:hypothetical protein